MPSTVYQRVRGNPKFHELVTRRARFSWALSAIVLVGYYSFMALVAFWPGLLATPLWQGAVTTVGVPVGIAIIVFSWLLTGLYVRRANTEFDAINNQVLEEANR